MSSKKDLFVPANQHEWTTLVRPPADYRLDCAIGTTFGLDFTALTALLLAMLDQRTGEAAWEQHAHKLQAVMMLDDRVRVLVNRSQIHAELRTTNRVLPLLDRIAKDVHIGSASFHPKVWVLKYVPRVNLDLKSGNSQAGPSPEGQAIYRFLCASRNLTIYSSWEAVACLEGRHIRDGEKESTGLGASISSFLMRATKDEGEPLPAALGALLNELPRVAFSTEGSSALKTCEFLWQWPGEKALLTALRPGGRTALVVSPFVRASALREMRTRFKRLVVVSRQEELDGCWESTKDFLPLEDVWVVKPDAAEESSSESAGAMSLELHAKLLFCDYGARSGGSKTEAWLGSANASPRGWGFNATSMNCEAMVRFTPGIEPDQFLQQFAYRPDGGDSKMDSPVLNGWIERYVPRQPKAKTADEFAESEFEVVRKAIASLPLTGRIERIGEKISFVLVAQDRAACGAIVSNHPSVNVQFVPMGLAEEESQYSDLIALAQSDVRFENLEICDAGSLLLVRMRHAPTSGHKSFVLQIDVDVEPGFWSERRTAFLRANLSAAHFRLFLRAILFGAAADGGASPETGGSENGNGVEGGNRSKSFLDHTSVEAILYACTRDRARIDEVDSLIKMFEGTEHVDAPFKDFWANFRQAVSASEKEALQ